MNKSLAQIAKDTKREAKEKLSTFTSAKLDWLDAVSIDPRVSTLEFRVAFIIAQHVNSETGKCCPSQETIATFIGKSDRAVREAVKRLEHFGWIIRRKRGQGTQYDPAMTHVNAMLDRRIMLRDALREEREHRKHTSAIGFQHRKQGSGQHRKPGSAEHLSEHLRDSSIEGRGNSYRAMKDGTHD